jgi:serine/threonine-protein kinase
MDWEKYVTVSSKFAEVIRKMLEISVRHRYKTAQQVLDALDMLPYEDGMMQGMISNTLSTGNSENSPVTGIRKVPSSPSYGDPSTNFNTNVNPSPRGPSSTRFNTGIQTRTTRPEKSPKPNFRDKNSPDTGVRPAPSPGSVGPVGGGSIDYNMASKKRLSRREEQSPVAKTETKHWTGQTFLAEYSQGKRDFADQHLVGLALPKAFIPGINCYQANLTNANFQQTELTRADFGKAKLKNAVLKDANLSDAYFGYTD